MRKSAFVLFALLSVCVPVVLGQQDLENVQVRIAQVAGNVYLLTGYEGNMVADIGDDGIVLVDDEWAALGDKIQAALKGVSDKPIRFVINTHYHDDHTDGNKYFQKQASIIAHDNVRRRLESSGESGNRGSLVFAAGPQPKDVLPILTFDHNLGDSSER